MPDPSAVAYAGEPGAFAEDAVLAVFGDVARTPLGSFRAVFEAVAAGDAPAGVVPIENVINGTVRENYDLLLEHELVDPRRGRRPGPASASRPCPASGSRTSSGSIRTSRRSDRPRRSCARARGNCSRRTTPPARARPSPSAAERGAAAVLSPRAATLFGLEVLADDIGDLPDNKTRFLVLARPDGAAPTLLRAGPARRTTLVVAVRNEPGTLLAVLRGLRAITA